MQQNSSDLTFDLSERFDSAENFLLIFQNLLMGHPLVEKMAVVNVPVLLRVQRVIDLFIFDNKFDHKTLKSGNFVNNLGKIR